MGCWCGPDGSGSVPWAWHSSQSQVSRLFQAEVVTGCSAAGWSQILRTVPGGTIIRSAVVGVSIALVLGPMSEDDKQVQMPGALCPLAGPEMLEVKLTI